MTDLHTLEPEYLNFLESIKKQVQAARTRAALAVNSELILLYWRIGREILERQDAQNWGTKVVDRLAQDLRAAFPDMSGFSSRNLKYMQLLAASYTEVQIVQQLVAQLPWSHNIRILEKVKTRAEREFYLRETIENGWSRAILEYQIDTQLFKRQGAAQTNLERTSPSPQSELMGQMLKDPYNFEFLSLGKEAKERDLEQGLLEHLRDFMLELGQGFAFVGSQYPLEVDERDFFIDLLFYHLKLRCYVVIDLKMGEFEPEYVRKDGFLCLRSEPSAQTSKRCAHAGTDFVQKQAKERGGMEFRTNSAVYGRGYLSNAAARYTGKSAHAKAARAIFGE